MAFRVFARLVESFVFLSSAGILEERAWRT